MSEDEFNEKIRAGIEMRRNRTANWPDRLMPYQAYAIEKFSREVEGERMPATTLNLYEVHIIDSRITDDQGAVQSFFVRSTSDEDAKIRALLRSQYDERDIKYLDVAICREYSGVKPVADDEDEDDD